MSGIYVVEHLIESLKSKHDDIKAMEIILVPVSNPDGFVYSATVDRFWRKNRNVEKTSCADVKNMSASGLDISQFEICNGVDLNRNFAIPGTAWSPTRCCTASYNGRSSRSEAESQALGKLVEEAPTLVHIDVHSFGQMVLGPYSFTYKDHDDKEAIDELGRAMRNAISKTHGAKYTYKHSHDVAQAEGLLVDWSTSLGAYGYIYELRPLEFPAAFTPPEDSILPIAEETFQGIYTAIDWAKHRVEHV
jgi:carboxypeptidase A2